MKRRKIVRGGRSELLQRVSTYFVNPRYIVSMVLHTEEQYPHAHTHRLYLLPGAHLTQQTIRRIKEATDEG